jgi:DNA-binding NtrC family response regulator
MHNAYQEESPKKERSSVKTILIVEDDPGIGQYISLAISQETPYLPLLVTDSVRALEVVRHIKPNLFILGYRLSSINGVELFDHLHLTEGLEAIPAIILSASLTGEMLENEIKPRNLMAINGPHALDEFLDAVEKAFASSAQGTATD